MDEEAAKQEEKPKQNPHMGQITVQAVIYKQRPDGQFSPETVWFDTFKMEFLGKTAEECRQEMDEKVKAIKGLNENDG